MVDRHTLLKPGAGLRTRVIDGEAVIFNQPEGEIVVLDDVGRRVLEAIGDGASTAEVVERLLAVFAVEQTQLEADLSRFVDELLEAGILVEAVGGGA